MDSRKVLLYVAVIVVAASGSSFLRASEKGPSNEFPLAISPDGKLLAAGDVGFNNGWKRDVRLFDLQSRKAVRGLMLPICMLSIPGRGWDTLMSLRFSPDGKLLAWGGYGHVHLFDVASRRHIRALGCYETNIVALAFSPDGKQLIANGGENIYRWNINEQGAPAAPPIPHPERVGALAFRGDGRMIASCGEGMIRLWDPTSGRQVHEVAFAPDAERGSRSATCLAFSPNSDSLLVGGDSLRLLLLDPPGPVQPVPVIHQVGKEPCFQVAFAPDGKTLAARGFESVRIYDTESGKLSATFRSPAAISSLREQVEDSYEKFIHNFVFTPDGKNLVMSYGRKGLGIWDVARPLAGPIYTFTESETRPVAESAEPVKNSQSGESPKKPAGASRAKAKFGALVNGSFEQREAGDPPPGLKTFQPGQDGLDGWEVVEKSLDWIGPLRWRASHGKQCLDLDGGIRQTIGTVPGASYEVRFDMAGNAEGEPMIQILRVLIDDRPHDFTFDSTGKSSHNLGWATRRVLFTANKEKTTLTFINARPNSNSVGVALDNIEVRPLGAAKAKTGSRQETLEKQIAGLIEEAAALRKAGRLKDAQGHEEKAAYRRRQLQELLEPPVASTAKGKPSAVADGRKGQFGAPARGLRMAMRPTKSKFAINEKLSFELLVQNIGNEEKQLWQETDPQRKRFFPDIRVTLTTPQGKTLSLRHWPPPLTISSEWTPPKPIPRKALPAGETYHGKTVLNEWFVVERKGNAETWREFDLKEPGRYTIQAVYYDYYPTRLSDGLGPYPSVVEKATAAYVFDGDLPTFLKRHEDLAKKIRIKSAEATFSIVGETEIID